MDIRDTVFAGSWYPARAAACEAAIKEFLAQDATPDDGAGSMVAGIVPHAGWVYSGRIACHVINRLKAADPPDVVVVFGMHLHPRSENVMMNRGAWATPFGHLPVAEALADVLIDRFDFSLESPHRFTQDNTIELQMPLVHYLLNPKAVLAVGVAPRSASLAIGEAVAHWAKSNGKRITVIGSTDLTHYGRNYGFLPHGTGENALKWVRNENDRRLVDTILDMQPERVIEEGLANQNACCAGAAATALSAAKAMGANRALLIDYATSHDISPGDSFVGYAGIVMGSD